MEMRKWLWITLSAAAAAGSILLLRKQNPSDQNLAGQTALITGGSRGLGFILARELLKEGCRVAICARDAEELERAKIDLVCRGGEVLAVPCDVSQKAQVKEMIALVTERFGAVDILINNAGIISVAPIQNTTIDDFERAHEVIFWGILYPTLALLPQMLARRSGRIVNITSIGGKVSVPHLLPYGTAKFAAVGFSEGLRAEVANSGVSVTTIVPGLMRTGSYFHALFGGRHRKEYTWFSLGSTLPLITIDAERAARQIIKAAKRREAVRILSIPAQILARLHGLFPGLTTRLVGQASALLLPSPSQGKTDPIPGLVVQRTLTGPMEKVLNRVTVLGERAAEKFQQMPKF
jgi:NAD(P)-dependent dehydrogenase (short-subunit alcohol dehydrogenase family)